MFYLLINKNRYVRKREEGADQCGNHKTLKRISLYFLFISPDSRESQIVSIALLFTS